MYQTICAIIPPQAMAQKKPAPRKSSSKPVKPGAKNAPSGRAAAGQKRRLWENARAATQPKQQAGQPASSAQAHEKDFKPAIQQEQRTLFAGHSSQSTAGTAGAFAGPQAGYPGDRPGAGGSADLAQHALADQRQPDGRLGSGAGHDLRLGHVSVPDRADGQRSMAGAAQFRARAAAVLSSACWD